MRREIDIEALISRRRISRSMWRVGGHSQEEWLVSSRGLLEKVKRVILIDMRRVAGVAIGRADYLLYRVKDTGHPEIELRSGSALPGIEVLADLASVVPGIVQMLRNGRDH